MVMIIILITDISNSCLTHDNNIHNDNEDDNDNDDIDDDNKA